MFKCFKNPIPWDYDLNIERFDPPKNVKKFKALTLRT